MPTLSSCYSWTILFHSPRFLNSAAAQGSLQPREEKAIFVWEAHRMLYSSQSIYLSFLLFSPNMLNSSPLLQNTFRRGIIAPISTPFSGTFTPSTPGAPPGTFSALQHSPPFQPETSSISCPTDRPPSPLQHAKAELKQSLAMRTRRGLRAEARVYFSLGKNK